MVKNTVYIRSSVQCSHSGWRCSRHGGEVIAQDMAKQQLGGRLVHVCQGCVVVLQDGSGYGVCVDRSSMTCAVSDDGPGSLYNQLSTTVGLRVVDRAE